jgi:hypothetical protein
MKKFRPAASALFGLVAVSVGLLCCSSQRSGAQVPTRVAPPTVVDAPTVVDVPSVTMTWEYKVLRSKVEAEKDIEKELNKLGHETWDLVSVTPNPGTGETLFYFKRAKVVTGWKPVPLNDSTTPR